MIITPGKYILISDVQVTQHPVITLVTVGVQSKVQHAYLVTLFIWRTAQKYDVSLLTSVSRRASTASTFANSTSRMV